jgi:hypothetical protein
VLRAGACPAAIRTVAEKPVITRIGIIGVLAHVGYTGIIRTYIKVIAISRVSVAEKPVITRIGIIGVLAHVGYTGIIRTHIKVIAIRRVYTFKRPHSTRLRRHSQE